MADSSSETPSPPRKRLKTPSPESNKSTVASRLIPNKVCLAEKKKIQENNVFLKDINAVVVEKGLGKTRTSLLIKQLLRHGGCNHEYIKQSTTHILVDRTMKIEKLCLILKLKNIPTHVQVVNADWLSACLSEGKVKDYEGFLISSSVTKQETDISSGRSAAITTADKEETGTTQNVVVSTHV